MATIYDNDSAKDVVSARLATENLPQTEPVTEKLDDIANNFMLGNYSYALKSLKSLITDYNANEQYEVLERVFLLPNGGAVELYSANNKLIIQERTAKEQEYYEAQITRFTKLLNNEISKLDVLQYYLPLAHRFFNKNGYIISKVEQKNVYSTIYIDLKEEKPKTITQEVTKVGNFTVIRNEGNAESYYSKSESVEEPTSLVQTSAPSVAVQSQIFEDEKIVNSIFEDDSVNYYATYDLNTLLLEKENINLNEHEELKVIENHDDSLAELLKSNKITIKEQVEDSEKSNVLAFEKSTHGKNLLNYYDQIRTYNLEEKHDYIVAKSNVFWKLQLLAVNKHIDLKTLLKDETLQEFQELAYIIKLFEIASTDISLETQKKNKLSGELSYNQMARLKLINFNDSTLLPNIKQVLDVLLSNNIKLSSLENYNKTVDNFLRQDDVKRALLVGSATIEDLLLVEIVNLNSELTRLYEKMCDNAYVNVADFLNK